MKKILLFSGDKKRCQMISQCLRRERYLVETTDSAEDTLSRLNHYSYDLAVLDQERDGIEICRSCRHRDNFTPVILIARRPTGREIEAIFNAGVNDIILEPVQAVELIARTRALLRRPIRIDPLIYRWKDLEIDLMSHRVMRNGRPIELLPQEFAILDRLLRSPLKRIPLPSGEGVLVDFPGGLSHQAMRTYISRIRAKIDTSGAPSVIQTLRGYGYGLRA